MTNKNLYIIAGPNGAGKTTASFTILPELLDCKEFVNATLKMVCAIFSHCINTKWTIGFSLITDLNQQKCWPQKLNMESRKNLRNSKNWSVFMEKNDFVSKVVVGLERTYKSMIEMKRQKNSPVVLSVDGQIKHMSPFEMPDEVIVKNPFQTEDYEGFSKKEVSK
jgi:guanylate kinase